MGHRSHAKREHHAPLSESERSLNPISKSADPSEKKAAYCPSCGGITTVIQGAGLYEGLIFDLPDTCPDCNHQTEIVTRDEWQLREAQVTVGNPTPPSA